MGGGRSGSLAVPLPTTRGRGGAGSSGGRGLLGQEAQGKKKDLPFWVCLLRARIAGQALRVLWGADPLDEAGDLVPTTPRGKGIRLQTPPVCRFYLTNIYLLCQ